MIKNDILILCVSIILLLSCRKEKINDPAFIKNLYRIKQVTSYNNNEETWKSEFYYEDEKLFLAMEYIKDNEGKWTTDHKTEVTYNGNIMTETGYSKLFSSWKKNEKHEYLIENELMKEERYYAYEYNQWKLLWKYTYQYSGNGLISWQKYDLSNTLSECVETGEYIYINNILSEINRFQKYQTDTWEQYDKETFTYSDNTLTGWIDYDKDNENNWNQDYKCDFLYTGDFIRETNCFYWDTTENTWQPDLSESFQYDVNGYLTGKISNNGESKLYEYEEGHGNAKYFWYYPEDLVYGTPVIKNAGHKRKTIPYYQKITYTDIFLR